ncbi:ATP-binding protein [candidate division CSSED10-310 bacterium]|uniref:histidine kinase n=1 Tax=candidate division CSSED10-310 bacterium TaxID=2855610 RepID=A0ABV6Z6L0_UNCC1
MPENAKILIVDDDESTRQTLTNILHEKGYDTDTAAYGREALEKVKKQFFNLAFIEINLPDMLGIELLDPFKKFNPDMMCIINTASASLETATRALNEGAAAYIIKPLNMDEVLTRIAEVLEKQRLVFQKRKTGQALRESEQRFRNIVERAEAGYFFVDNLGIVRDVNRAWLRMHGYHSPEEIIGQSYNLVQNEPQRDETQDILEGFNEKDTIAGGVFTRRLKDGSVGYHTLSMTPVFQENKLAGFEGFAIDITSRKQAEEELRKRTEQLQIIHTIDQAILGAQSPAEIAQAVIHHMRTVLQCQAAAIVLHNSRDNKLQQLAHYISSDSGSWTNISFSLAGAEDFLKVLHKGEVLKIADIRHLDKPPPILESILEMGIISLICVPLLSRDQLFGLFSVGWSRPHTCPADQLQLVQEIANPLAVAIHQSHLYEQVKKSHQALAEERALLAQRVKERTAELQVANIELERAARMKDEFLASMSHELRTPLNVILGMSESLQEDVYGALTEKQKAILSKVHESGQHLLSLINDVLDVSKIAAGKLRLAPELVDLEKVCKKCLELIETMAIQKLLKISFSFDRSITEVYVDQKRLIQILFNLLSNAVKFTPEQGALGLVVTSDPKNNVVNLTICDTGIGISETDIKNLFQPFMQLDSSLSRQYNGTGLGLVLAQRLTHLHGGDIFVESKVNQGSRFTVTIPWIKKIPRE